jgi:hypothetical protein
VVIILGGICIIFQKHGEFHVLTADTVHRKRKQKMKQKKHGINVKCVKLLGGLMRFFKSKEKRDEWVNQKLKEHPSYVFACGNFLPIKLWCASIISRNNPFSKEVNRDA